MIEFDPDELLDALDRLARREGLVARLDRGAALAALAEARWLSAGRPELEPAALLYAFGHRSRQFGAALWLFLRGLLRAHAAANGFELEMTDVEFATLSAGVARGEIEALELRGWFSARLRPLGQKSKRPPPKRPR